MSSRTISIAIFLVPASLFADNWPQAAGPNGNYQIAGDAPTTWSVVRNENIAWKVTLPETGQSSVVVAGDRLFFTCLQPVTQDSTLGKDVIAYCCDAASGKVLWERAIGGEYPLRLSGCFSDSTGPAAVTDGKRVCFFNASGTIACFDFQGELLWQRRTMAAGRSQPFFVAGAVVFIRQTYMPDEMGNFGHEHENAPPEQWTQLQALDLQTGEPRWTSACGVGMGCVPLPGELRNGRSVILVGRGGGHSPPEKPEGLSLIDVGDGQTIWTLPLDGFMSTQTLGIRADQAMVFHGGEHLWVNANTGEIAKRVSIIDRVSALTREEGAYVPQTLSIPDKNKGRMIIQQSNLLVGDYHYFRSYARPYLGRVHAATGSTEYLQLPIQLQRERGQQDVLVWEPSEGLLPSDMINSRGFVVVGDKRSRTHTWGHHAAPIPTVAGDYLLVPTMNGTVYVIRWNARTLNADALVAINDLGSAGRTWTRASLNFVDGKLYAHSLRELICIENRAK